MTPLMSQNVVWSLECSQILGVVCREVDNTAESTCHMERGGVCCYGYGVQIRVIPVATRTPAQTYHTSCVLDIVLNDPREAHFVFMGVTGSKYPSPHFKDEDTKVQRS